MEWREAFFGAVGFTLADVMGMIVAIYHQDTLTAATHATMLPLLLAAVAFTKVREIYTATSETDWDPGGAK